MAEKGYIKLNRKFFLNPLWSETRVYSKAEAWIDLIQLARFEASTEIILGKAIDVQRGEIPVSRRFLELRWGWGSTKVSNFLKTLCDLDMINQKQTTGQTIITLLNYDTYNGGQTSRQTTDKPPANQAQPTNQRQTTDKPPANQNKEGEERKENIPPYNPPAGDVGDVPEKSWRDDFEVYLDGLRKAYETTVTNKAYMAEKIKYHPGVNILLSLEKVCKEFWATEKGWKHKKKSKSKEIDWKSTFTNSLDMSSNRVWLQKGQTNEEYIDTHLYG
jgi:hypothetical protein